MQRSRSRNIVIVLSKEEKVEFVRSDIYTQEAGARPNIVKETNHVYPDTVFP